MSFYSSDYELDMMDSPHGIDVAYHCLGDDVRLILRFGTAYLNPDEAREVAQALIRNADLCEQHSDVDE